MNLSETQIWLFCSSAQNPLWFPVASGRSPSSPPSCIRLLMVWLLPTAPASWVNPAPDLYTLTALNYAPQASGLYTGYFLGREQSLPSKLSLWPHRKSLLSPLVAYTEPTMLIRCHFWASTAPWASHPTLTLLPVPPSHPDPLYLCLLMPVLSMLSCHCEFIHIYQHGHVDTCRHAQTPQACTQNDTHVQMYR